MITTIIFDLDGVLVDTKLIHFHALNKALKSYNCSKTISYDEHVKMFDGLPTNQKLKKLNKLKRLPTSKNKKVKSLKQKITIDLLKKDIKFDKNVYSIFKFLSKKYKLAIATNAVESTLDICINKLKIKKFVNFSIANEKVKNPKPHPEIYLKCMLELDAKPKECLVVEDSYNGRKAAQDSGSVLFPINNLKDLKLNEIKNFLENKNLYSSEKQSWIDKDLNILIPMAGAGSRFEKAGYSFPKPLIEINNKPMIQWVLNNINIKANYIFIVQKAHQDKFNISSLLKILAPRCKIVYVSSLTEGAACTTLLAKKFINNNKSLIIANSDQYIEWDSSKIMYSFASKTIDGGILTFDSLHPKWSYAKTNKKNIVTEVAEKKVISNNATVGIYFWRKGSDYVKYAEEMIKKNIRVNNEFYVCPVYNQAIKDKKIIKIEKVEKMWGLGTPEDLNHFMNNFLSKKN